MTSLMWKLVYSSKMCSRVPAGRISGRIMFMDRNHRNAIVNLGEICNFGKTNGYQFIIALVLSGERQNNYLERDNQYLKSAYLLGLGEKLRCIYFMAIERIITQHTNEVPSHSQA